LVVPGGVQPQFAQQLYVGVEDADVAVADEHQDAGAGVAAAQPDVVQPAVVPQGDDAAGVDAVVADSVVAGVEPSTGRDGLRAGEVGLQRGAAPPW
jgi:hypothetical protein